MTYYYQQTLQKMDPDPQDMNFIGLVKIIMQNEKKSIITKTANILNTIIFAKYHSREKASLMLRLLFTLRS